MKIRPLHDRVVIKRVEAEEKTASGIVLPGNAAEKPDMGEVVAVGNGKILENGNVRPIAVKAGDKVVYKTSYPNTVQNVKVDGKDLLIMSEEDILGVIEG